MAYDKDGRYYFNPFEDSDDATELEIRRVERDKQKTMDAILDQQDLSSRGMAIDREVLDEISKEYPDLTVEDLKEITSDADAFKEYARIGRKAQAEFVRRRKGKAGAPGKPTPAAQPGVSSGGREKLEKIKEKRVPTEDDQLDALSIVLGIGPNEPFIKD